MASLALFSEKNRTPKETPKATTRRTNFVVKGELKAEDRVGRPPSGCRSGGLNQIGPQGMFRMRRRS